MKNDCLLEARIPLLFSRGSCDCCVIFYFALEGVQMDLRTNETNALADRKLTNLLRGDYDITAAGECLAECAG